MFHKSFTARVGERMAIWGAMLGFLLLLYVASEIIQSRQMRDLAAERQRATAAALAHATESSSRFVSGRERTELVKKLIAQIEAVNIRQMSLSDNHRQNKILLLLLATFVMSQILLLEHRWLIKPIVRIAEALRVGEPSPRLLKTYALRRDEIGLFAQALASHYDLVRKQQAAAESEQATLSERLRHQEEFHRESLAFQARIAEIVQQLQGHSSRMADASQHLVSISTEAESCAAVSVQSTERVSGHVDAVVSSIRAIAVTLATVAEEARRTSAVATAARSAVEAAEDDAKAMSEGARTIEQVIALIEDVAEQTNLLALNATIEAARAGEAGRGFSVVAHEVKQLATRTSQATEDVRGRLQGITAASLRIVDRVAALAQAIDQVADVVGGIAQSMRMQDANSQVITSNTTQTAGNVHEMAATVKEVAGMISRAKQAADAVTKVSTDLGQQASDLRAAVERFMQTTRRVAA
ncbi:MAG TPA: methyl-accepting chemotaxis protein [Xanthobacteraceae bacterium]|nr:methyl-accepting chemotaxis protein [Xanthobacteraceae bacterium]